MAELLIEDPDGPEDTTIGGRPLAPPGTQWPACASCESPMPFLAQIPLRDRDQVLLLFQCQSDPGMCDEWDPESGGNAALLVDADGRVPLDVPEGPTLLPGISRLRRVVYEEPAPEPPPEEGYERYDEPPVDYPGAPVVAEEILGKLAGRPNWIQRDETPTCRCGAPLVFFAQLEDRGGGGINFGGMGRGYVFVCPVCPDSARFLWQCG